MNRTLPMERTRSMVLEEGSKRIVGPKGDLLFSPVEPRPDLRSWTRSGCSPRSHARRSGIGNNYWIR